MERPIIFNDAMARAILSGAKTETRRPVCRSLDETTAREIASRKRPFGKPGDTLWVREAWRPEHLDTSVEYRADKGAKWFDASMMRTSDYDDAVRWSKKLAGGLWAPSIHMPRWAARTVLDVLEVRVERLQDMTEEDARAEGFAPFKHIDIDQPFGDDWRTNRTHPCTLAFASAWDGIYPTMRWSANPWVWVVRFKRQGGA